MILYTVQQLTGYNILLFYSTDIFLTGASSTSIRDETAVRVLNLLLGTIKILGALGGGYVADKLGRRVLIVYGSIGITVLAAMIAFSDSLGLDDSLQMLVLLYAGVQSLTYSVVLPIFLGELLPAYGISLLVAYDYLCTMIGLLAFPFLGTGIAFTFFAVIGGAFFLPVFALTKETKGKTLHEIYKMFHAEKNQGLLDEEVSEDTIILH